MTRIITPHNEGCKGEWIITDGADYTKFPTDALPLECELFNCRASAEIDGADLLKLLEPKQEK